MKKHNRKKHPTPLRRKKALKAGKPLQAGKPLERRTPLKAGKPLERRTPLKRTSIRQRIELHTKLGKSALATWQQRVIEKRCARCVSEGLKQDRHGTRDPHHVLPARYIRRYVRTLRKAENLDYDEAVALLIRLLYDPRNGLCLCRRCHERHEQGYKRIPRALLPKKAWQFARELGMEHVLERLYPEAA